MTRKWLIDLPYPDAIKEVIRLNMENDKTNVYFIYANCKFQQLDHVGVYKITEGDSS